MTPDLIKIGKSWFQSKGWKTFPFQEETWRQYLDGKNGIVNAPTGSGKTYSIFIATLLEHIRDQEGDLSSKNNGLQIIWITPIRALAKEIHISTTRAIEGLGLQWKVGIRHGDTKTSERQNQRKNAPEVMITTPESLHLLLTYKGYPNYFKKTKAVIVDEWHELIGSKRGVQVELALSRFRAFIPRLKIWGISATIGNMDDVKNVLMGNTIAEQAIAIVKSDIKKEIEIASIIPDQVEEFSWGGHMGLKLLNQVIPILEKSKTTLMFVNTRAQCEVWYKKLIETAPQLIGLVGMHHGSISREIRDWVESQLYDGKLKAVVCTSSLDLGVDFRPVESIIQIGSAKGVSRFIQRAGRSGHQPGALSRIYFLPTHAMEMLEAPALRKSIETNDLEPKIPYIRAFDVLIQYCVTLSLGEGFEAQSLFNEVKSTHCYESISEDEWAWVLDFITTGGDSLRSYNEYQKVVHHRGRYEIVDQRTARRHRMSMGTIVSDSMMEIKYNRGKRIGTVEERFISGIRVGETFWFAGRALELVKIVGDEVIVRNSSKKMGRIPSYGGGRFPLSSQMSNSLRMQIHHASKGQVLSSEVERMMPLLEMQSEVSVLPADDQFLVEYFESEDGYHLVFYPFEGRLVNEGFGSLMAFRLSEHTPMSFSIAMNEYGVEVLCNKKPPLDIIADKSIFHYDKLHQDIYALLNTDAIAQKRFRDIAGISGLVFSGYPNKQKKERHLQASSGLFFKVFSDYDAENLLLNQAYEEARTFILEEERLRNALKRVNEGELIITTPEKFSPFAFPIIVEGLREKMTTERLEDRIEDMQLKV